MNERIRLFAGYLNIVAAGSLVAALVTEPFSWALAGKAGLFAEAPFVLISFGLSILFHGAAQLTLARSGDDKS